MQRTDQTPTITSDALITAVAVMPALRPSSSDASLVIEAVIVTVGDTSIVTCVVVAPGFTFLIVPAIWLRAESFIVDFLVVADHLSLQARCMASKCLRAASAVSISIAR